MRLNYLLLLPTASSTVHVSTDLAKMRAKEQVDLVLININGLASLCTFYCTSLMKMVDKSIYLIILTRF